IGAMIGTFLAANLTTYFVVKKWCFQQSRNGNESLGCDASSDHTSSAQTVRSINITAGVALIVTYVWGVYDGVRRYGRTRREPALVPYANSTNGGSAFGVQLK